VEGLLKNIEKTGSPGKTRTCDIWINSPPFQYFLLHDSSVNSTHPSTSTLRLFALNGLEGTEKDSS